MLSHCWPGCHNAQVVFALSRAAGRGRLVDRTLGCRVHLFSSEAELLRAALEYVKQQDPDALVLFQARRSRALQTPETYRAAAQPLGACLAVNTNSDHS